MALNQDQEIRMEPLSRQVKGAAKPESNDGGAVGAGDTVDGGGLARARCLFDTVHVDASEAGV